MKYKDLIYGIAFLLIGVFLCIETFSYSYSSSIFLRFLALSITTLSLIFTFKSFFNIKKTVQEENEPKNYLSAILIFSLVIFFIIMIKVFGFFIANVIFIYLSLIILSKKICLFYFPFSIVFSLFIFTVFFTILGVPLPESLLQFDQYIKF